MSEMGDVKEDGWDPQDEEGFTDLEEPVDDGENESQLPWEQATDWDEA